MQPQPGVSIRRRAVFILEIRLHPRDDAILAWRDKIFRHEFAHSIIDGAGWDIEWTVANLYALGVEFGEEFGM